MPWGLRVCNDILAVLVVELTVSSLLFYNDMIVLFFVIFQGDESFARKDTIIF